MRPTCKQVHFQIRITCTDSQRLILGMRVGNNSLLASILAFSTDLQRIPTPVIPLSLFWDFRVNKDLYN